VSSDFNEQQFATRIRNLYLDMLAPETTVTNG
jgi:hypothetical protein